ncbi:hypothetical protein [Pseudosporangium ferrugineum]|uniref:Uncharacterized protein n=1 Tax=Pseudosporangium ferrugineum TaxID=439699 RepID=A0A2T0RSF7_9ACTN|nr:hypothetical protein [Pseudosporangium ferrugineum]PRY24023.1 hypothetical protein CLV70_114156 [Pseudosporangium ferrugineum]
MHGQKLIEHSDITRVSLRTWKLTRSMFGEFVEAHCSRSGGFRNYQLDAWLNDANDYVPLTRHGGDSPTLVLIDDSGSELWLGGCASGYSGEGVSGAGYILRSEGFSSAHIDLLPHAKLLHLRKDQAEPLAHREADERPQVREPWSQHIERLIATGYFRDVEAA